MSKQQPPDTSNILAQQERDERLGGDIPKARVTVARRHATSLRLAPAPWSLPQRDATRPREALAACADDELHERLGN